MLLYSKLGSESQLLFLDQQSFHKSSLQVIGNQNYIHIHQNRLPYYCFRKQHTPSRHIHFLQKSNICINNSKNRSLFHLCYNSLTTALIAHFLGHKYYFHSFCNFLNILDRYLSFSILDNLQWSIFHTSLRNQDSNLTSKYCIQFRCDTSSSGLGNNSYKF